MNNKITKTTINLRGNKNTNIRNWKNINHNHNDCNSNNNSNL